MFIQLLSTIKVSFWMKWCKCLFMWYFTCQAQKKLPFIAVLIWFLILGKIQDGCQDGDYCWWLHRSSAAPPPIKYTSTCWEDQRLSTEGKIVSKYCNISKILERGSINPPCTTVGVWTSERVNRDLKIRGTGQDLAYIFVQPRIVALVNETLH